MTPWDGLSLYTGSPDDDLRVAQWWLQMSRDEDLDATFSGPQTMAGLFRMIAKPHTMVYATDEHGIWAAMWGEPVLSAVFTGLWIRRPRRATRGALWFMLDALTWYLCAAPVVFGATKHENLLDAHRRLGYVVLDRVEGWMHGQDGWIVKLTRPALAATLHRYGRPSVELAQAMDASLAVEVS